MTDTCRNSFVSKLKSECERLHCMYCIEYIAISRNFLFKMNRTKSKLIFKDFRKCRYKYVTDLFIDCIVNNDSKCCLGPRINFSIPSRIIMHAKYLVFSRLCMKITVYLYWNLTRNVDLHNVSVVLICLKACKSTLSCAVFYQIHTSYSNCNLLS